LSSSAYEDAERNAAVAARTPIGRWAEADEMAGAALFLCSEAAGFVIGATLPVDGGYSAF
jgi:NAD(P)-dependent dehydrogenase (short-subunit alcohol dehydrogenase family)